MMAQISPHVVMPVSIFPDLHLRHVPEASGWSALLQVTCCWSILTQWKKVFVFLIAEGNKGKSYNTKMYATNFCS